MTNNHYVNINCKGEVFETLKGEIKKMVSAGEASDSRRFANIVVERLSMAQRAEKDKHIKMIKSQIANAASELQSQGVSAIRILECVEASSELQPELSCVSGMLEIIQEQFSSDIEVVLLEARYSGAAASIFDKRVKFEEIQPMFSYEKMMEAIAKTSVLMEEAGIEIDVEAIARDYPKMFQLKELELEQL